MLTQAQKDYRQNYLGGTDIAAILGTDSTGARIDPYKTALEVYLEKKGEIAAFQGNIHTQAGSIFEKSILEFYQMQEDAVPLKKLTDDQLELIHPNHPFLIGHPDAIDENGGIIDAKNVGFRARFQWGETDYLDIPRQYIIQACFYMAISNTDGKINAPYAKIVAYFGGSEIKVYTIPYKAAQCEGIIRKAVSFWNENILANNPPSPLSYSEVADYFKPIEGTTKVASPEILQALEEYKVWKATLEKDDEVLEQIKLRLGVYMGEAEVLLDEGGKKLLTFREQVSKRVDPKKIRDDGLFDKYCKESVSRVMRFTNTGDN